MAHAILGPMADRFTLLMFPPQTAVTREWARRLGEEVPEVRAVVAETEEEAEREIGDAPIDCGLQMLERDAVD